jgi:S-adenosylmethionine:tRNA ribosyltransferase-isomerase
MVVDSKVIQKINEHKKLGGRIVAVGTTVVRFLESIKEDTTEYKHSKINEDGTVNIDTNLFIHPGYKFKTVDAMITNFHQPSSSHLLLVEAFMGKVMLAKSYEHALLNGYRFLSYGDGMFIE